MVRLALHYREGPVQLLDKYGPDHLVPKKVISERDIWNSRARRLPSKSRRPRR